MQNGKQNNKGTETAITLKAGRFAYIGAMTGFLFTGTIFALGYLTSEAPLPMHTQSISEFILMSLVGSAIAASFCAFLAVFIIGFVSSLDYTLRKIDDHGSAQFFETQEKDKEEKNQ